MTRSKRLHRGESIETPGDRLLRSGSDVFVLMHVRLYRDGIADALCADPRLYNRQP